jgi:ribosomal protein L40E
MIICRACGVRNQDGESFCGECGAYLEWEGEREAPTAAPGPPPPPEPVPEPAPEGPGLVRRIRSAVGIGTEGGQLGPPAGDNAPQGHPPSGYPVPPSGPTNVTSATGALPSPSGTATPAPGPTNVAGALPTPSGTATPAPGPTNVTGALPTPSGTATPAPGPTTAPGAGYAAAPSGYATAPAGPAHPAGVPTAAGTAPAPDSAPAPVRPGTAAPKPRQRELPPEDRRPAPGETICGNCGAGNAPTRKFCRRCGTDLVDAPVVPRAPWWRRILQARRRQDPAAGTRQTHRARRRHRGLAVTAVIAVLLGGGGWLARAPLSREYRTVLDRVQGTKIVNPTSFRASGSAPGHDPTETRDGAPNRYWAPPPSAKPQGQWVQMGFTSAYRLVYLRVFSGASDHLADYLKQASPHVLRLTILRTGGKTSTRDVTLNDRPGSQSVHLAVDDVVGVRLTIRTVYRSAPGKLVAIGEVEFLGRA